MYSRIGTLLEMLGWVVIAVSLLIAVAQGLSGGSAIAFTAISAAVGGIFITGLGVIIDKLHAIELHLRKPPPT